MDFNFTDPTVLSNAIIFHDSVSNQIRGTEYSERSFYTLPSYPSPTASKSPRCGGYNITSEYIIPLPVEDTFNTPYTIKDIISGREYVKMVMVVVDISHRVPPDKCDLL